MLRLGQAGVIDAPAHVRTAEHNNLLVAACMTCRTAVHVVDCVLGRLHLSKWLERHAHGAQN